MADVDGVLLHCWRVWGGLDGAQAVLQIVWFDSIFSHDHKAFVGILIAVKALPWSYA